MAKFTQTPANAGTPEAGDVEDWLAAVAAGRPAEERDVLRRAVSLASRAHAGQRRASGEPYVRHSLAVAKILADLGLDHETLAAAILHDVVEDSGIALEDLKRDFGARIASLVDGVTKMNVIQEFQIQPGSSRREHTQAESLRKMLLAMAEDVRVVFIKLADRLHNMRTLDSLSEEKQKRIARETMDIFAPLANRLGIWQMKWELEDLAFRYLEPVEYKRIAGFLAERREDREAYIDRFVATLAQELRQAEIAAEVSGRPKHIYSIWRKMQKKGRDFERIFDVRAVRVLVNDIRDCYAALGVVHSLWQHIPGEFDDYIATPKENHYRSIHTAVIGPDGKTVEVQIRTHDMHNQSELGVASHWRYKEGAKEGARADKSYDAKIAWLRSLLEWKDEIASASDFVDQFKSEVFSERVYVFTPKGNIVDLPAGATPLDFAYDIHTDVGHRCRGAKVNGQMVPLTHPLKTGDRVEVLTVKQGGPSRDWLSPHLGYLHTSKARTRVSHWFREQNLETSIAEGRAVLEREFHRLGIGDVNYEKLASRFQFHRVDDFLAAAGRGDIKPAQIMAAVQEFAGHALKEARPVFAPRAPTAPRPPAGVTIQGVGNLLTRTAKCCNPLPGDPIVGFITRGKGVTVHLQTCPTVANEREVSRLIEVEWEAAPTQSYPIAIRVEAYDRTGLLSDITQVVAEHKVNILAAHVAVTSDHTAVVTATLQVASVSQLAKVMSRIEMLKDVTSVQRDLG
jgi:GTP pyrophosphokinase